MQAKAYEVSRKQLSKALEVLFGVLLREPHLAICEAHKFKRCWFDYAPASIAEAVSNFFKQLDSSGTFSVYAASASKLSAERLVECMASAGDVTFEAAVAEAAEAVDVYVEQVIALNTLGEWSALGAEEIRKRAYALRACARLDTVENQSDDFDTWFDVKLRDGQPSYPCFMSLYNLTPYMRYLEPGTMTVIAARPSVGKTYFLLNLILPWLSEGLRGFFVSLDMSTTMLKARALGMLSGINPRADWSMLSADDVASLRMHKSALDAFDLTIVDGISDVDTLERLIKSAHAVRPLDFLAVDHLQLLSLRGAQTRYQMITEVSGRLKVLAKALGLPVIVVSQLNRAVEARASNMPTLADLRESGAIEQDATYVIGLKRVRNEDTSDAPEAQVVVLKNQNGPTSGPIDMHFHPVLGWLAFKNDMCAKKTNYTQTEQVPF